MLFIAYESRTYCPSGDRMKTPSFFHLVKALPVSLTLFLTACGGSDPSTTPASPSSENTQQTVIVSQQNFADVQLPQRYVNGQTVNFVNNTAIARRGLPASSPSDTLLPFPVLDTSIQNSAELRIYNKAGDSGLSSVLSNVDGNFFARLTGSLASSQPVYERIFFTFAQSNKAINLCTSTCSREIDITLTGINPSKFDVSTGALQLVVYAQTVSDISSNQFKQIATRTINWQPVNINVTTAERQNNQVVLSWQPLGGDYSHYNVYYQQDNLAAQQQLGLTATNFSFADSGQNYQIQIKAVNSHGESAESQVIFINNQPPVFAQTKIILNEDTISQNNILSNISDPEQQQVTFASGEFPTTNGTLLLTAAGDISYTPNVNFTGTDTFTFELTDSFNANSNATIEFEVLPVNDAPTASDDSLDFDSGQTSIQIPYSILLANDSDIDGDNLTIDTNSFSNIENAQLQTSNDSLTLTISLDFIGQIRFSYQAQDPQGLLSASANVVVNIGDISQSLRAINDVYQVNEDQSLTDNLASNDTINTSLPYSISITSLPLHGSLDAASSGSFVYTPDANFNGVDSFQYQLTQGDASAQAFVQITITAVDDLPLVVADNYSVDKNTLLTVTAENGVLANDSEVDGESLTATLVTPPAQGELSLNSDGSFSYQANEIFVGNLTFVYLASDSAGSSAQQTVSINVKDVNLPPVVQNGQFVTTEEQSISISLSNLVTVPEGAALTFTIETNAQNGQATIEAGILKYQPNTHYFGPDQVIFAASDGVNTKVVGQIDLSVTAVNDVPFFTQSSFEVAEDTNKSIVLADFVQDIEQDAVTYAIQQAPQFGVATISEGTLSYTPNLNFSGIDTISITLTDSQGASNTVVIQFAVAVENDPPVFNVVTLSGIEDQTLSIDLTELVTDPDGDTLTFTLLAAAQNGQTTLNGNTLIFVPNPEFSGEDKVQLQVSDGLATDSAEFPLSIQAVNDAPVIQNAVVSLNVNSSALIDLADYASDVENDSLTYSIQASPTQGAVSIDGSSLTYTPNNNYIGADSLSYIANDGEHNSNTATISLNIINDLQSFSPSVICHLSIDDSITDIVVNDNLVYLAQQSGIAIYDVSDRSEPSHLETITTSSTVKKLYYHSGILYAVLAGGNLESWDVLSSSTPTNLASLHLGGEITDITSAGPYLLVANAFDGVDFIYSDQGQTLTKALQFNHHEKVIAVTTNGDFIVMATEQALYVLDTDDIETPDLSKAAKYNLTNISSVYLSEQNMLHVACNLCGYKVFKLENSSADEQDSSGDSDSGTTQMADVPIITLLHDNNRFFPSDIAVSQGYAVFNDRLFNNALPIVNITSESAPNFSQLINLTSVSFDKVNALTIDNQYVYAVANSRLYIGQYRALANAADDASTRFKLDYFAFLNPQVTANAFFEIQASYQASDDINELVKSVSFYIDDQLLGTDSTWPYSYRAQAKTADFVVKARFTFVDGVEFDVTQTLSPLPDSDGDGLSDLIEISQYKSDKDLTDSDTDGLPDLTEAIIFSKLDQIDSDNDGIDDKIEYDANESPINPDRTVASILTQSPAADATEVCEYEPVLIQFDETVSVRNINTSNFQLMQGDELIAATVSFLQQNNSIKLEPSSNLDSNTTYDVFVPAVADLAGNLTGAFSYSFTTGACTESARPSVASILPDRNSTNIATNTRVIIKIDEAVKASTINTSNVKLTDLTTNQNISGTVSLQGNNDVIIFVPDAPLKAGRRHYLTLSSAITDLFDNPLFSYTAQFTTGYQADTTAPQITTFSLRENDSAVPINTVLAAKFTEAIDPLNLSGITLINQTDNQAVDVSLSLVDDNTRLLIQPKDNLAANTVYQLTVANVSDSSANVLAQAKTLNFTTSDDSLANSIDVVNWSFKSSQTQMPLLPLISVEYSSPIDPTSINNSSIYLWDSAVSQRVATNYSWSMDQTRIVVTPSAQLKPNRRYTLYVSYDQRLTNITNSNAQQYRTRSFTTGSINDDTAPNLLDTGITTNNLVVNQPIIIGFNEAINPYCQYTQVKLTDSEGVTIDHSFSISSSLNYIEITPAVALSGDSQYTLSISDVCDMAGNALPAQQLQFTTASSTVVDGQAPKFSSMLPVHTSKDVALSSQIAVTFDEAVSPLSSIKVTHSGIEVSGTTVISGNTITFVPNEPLRGGTRYSVTTAYTVMDIFGNSGFLSTKYFDTVEQADNDKPQVVSTSPANGQTEVSPTQTVQIMLDEAISSSAIHSNNLALFHNGEKLSASISRSADNKTIIVNSTLPEHALISLVLTSGLTDLDGNQLDPYVMSFTTGANSNEVTRPSVLDVTPPATSYRLTNLDTLYLYMSESIDESSLTDNLFVTEDGVLLPIQIEMLANDRIIKLTSTSPFKAHSLIEIRLTTGVTDYNGNRLYAYNSSLTMSNAVDTAGAQPYPIDYSPNNFSQIDILNPVIRIKYSEPLAQSSIVSSNFVLTNTTQNTIVPVTLDLSSNQSIVSVSPQIELTAGESYTLRIEKTIVDTDGDSPTTARSMYFTIASDALVDNRSPEMTRISPAELTENVPLQSLFSVEFDEEVDILAFDYSNSSFNSLIISSDNKVVTLKLAEPLNQNENYSLAMPDITDFAGNHIAEITTNFTTGSQLDFASPTLISQTEILDTMSRTPKFYWQYSETLNFTSLDSSQVFIYDTVENKQIPVNISLSHKGTRVNMQPQSQLAANRQYYYSVYGLKDLVGKTVSYQSRYFTTGFDADTTPPELIAASMLDGAQDIPINHRINLRFSEAITLTDNAVIQLKENGEEVKIDTSLSRKLTMLTITPKQLLQPHTQYELTVNGIDDLAENSLEQGIVINFTTGAQADLLNMDIDNWTMVQSNQADVPLNAEFIIEFSDNIDRATIDADSLNIYDNNHGRYIDVEYSYSDDLNSVKVKPTDLLDANTSYTLYISGSPYITDLGGNRSTYRWYSFTTGSTTDTTAPSVAATSFANQSTDIPVNAQLSIKFSERISRACFGECIKLVDSQGNNIDMSGEIHSDFAGATITFDQGLSPLETYQLVADGLLDYAGNSLSGTLHEFSTGSIAVEDTVAPNLLSITPAHNSNDISLSTTQVQLTFDEDISLLSKINVSADSYDVPGQQSVSGSTLTFTFDEALRANTRYTIEIYSNIADIAGNTRNLSTRRFDTDSTSTDTSVPQIVSVSPSAGSSDIQVNQEIWLEFSEPMNSSTLNSNHIRLFENGQLKSTSVSRSADGKRVKVTAGTFSSASTVSVVVNASVTDITGNSVAPFVASFTTGVNLIESARPYVVRQYPAANSTINFVSDNIQLYLSESIAAATVPSQIQIAVNGEAQFADVTQIASNVIQLKPTQAWQVGDRIDYSIPSQIRDLAGNYISHYNANLTIADINNSNLDVTAYYPSSHSTDLPTNVQLSLSFNQVIDSNDVSDSFISLHEHNTGNLVPANLTLHQDGKIVFVTPTAPLTPDTFYRLTVKSGLRSDSGKQLISNHNSYYTVGADGVDDTVAPSVLAFSPADGLANVGINPEFALQFDESINPLLFTTNDWNTAKVMFEDSNTVVTYQKHQPLTPASPVTETIANIQDHAGNTAAPHSVNITTAAAHDFTSPARLAVNFSSGQEDIATNAAFELVFSEAINPVKIASSIHYLYNNATGDYVDASLDYSAHNSRIKVTPTQVLDTGTRYSLYIGGIKDVAGNTGPTLNYSFTTGFNLDTTAPVVLNTSIANGQNQIAINSIFRVAFDEPISNLDTADVVLTHSSGQQTNVAVEFESERKILVIKPQSLLQADSNYQLQITQASDISGNTINNPVSLSFTTQSNMDITAPVISSYNYTNAEVVDIDFVAQITLSEVIDPTSVNDITLVLEDSNGNKVLGNTLISTDKTSLSYQPSAELQADTSYYLYVSRSPYIYDAAGNRLSYTYRRFITNSAD